MKEDARPWLRQLPAVQRLLEGPEAAVLEERHGRPVLVDALRATLREARSGGAPLSQGELLDRAAALLDRAATPVLRRVVNATGVVLHTNLGRAPLAPEAAAAALAAAGYCNLEWDAASGGRGSRLAAVDRPLRALTGAEAGLAVNNGAAALLLALAALAGNGEVVVSRGELVEIGGGFRVPDVVQQGGARLVEVGTTNRTRLADYERAITADTRLLLKVHQSNYRILGFTAAAELAELSVLARSRGVPLVYDSGSGVLGGVDGVRRAVAAGAELVTFSGDKLLGGPQAGLAVGRAALVDRLRAHPLYRALRLDKMTLAALEATLRLHGSGLAAQRVPVVRMLAADEAALQARAERLLSLLPPSLLPGRDAVVEASQGTAGGGSLPGETRPSRAVSLRVPGLSAAELAGQLRAAEPPVASRLSGGRVALDMLAVAEEELPDIARAVRRAMDGAA